MLAETDGAPSGTDPVAAIPRFSVLIPSRNRLDLLRFAVQSVIRQDFDNWEIVVSDNASTDDYRGFIAGLNDPRIRYLRSDLPLSVTDNWNRALLGATGEYIVMLGDDDALAPNYFSALQAIILRFSSPELIYSMAFHYAYPGVVPGQPTGYLATINNSPVFRGHTEPYLLDPDYAGKLGRMALRFRHEVSFNAQHFLYRRSFIATLAKFGPFYQSPYPDYYCCFLTFLTARSIVVDPSPRIIIGISPKSFGFFFMNNREQEGAAQFLANGLNDAFLAQANPSIAAALRLPGSDHTRNWLVAALCVQHRLSAEMVLSVDLRRYGRLQIFDIAYRNAYDGKKSHAEFWTAIKDFTPANRRFGVRMFHLFLILRRATALSPPKIFGEIRELLGQYAAVDALFHEIGSHRNVDDAIRWLESREITAQRAGPVTSADFPARRSIGTVGSSATGSAAETHGSIISDLSSLGGQRNTAPSSVTFGYLARVMRRATRMVKRAQSAVKLRFPPGSKRMVCSVLRYCLVLARRRLSGGPYDARVVSPEDWATVGSSATFEIVIEGCGDIDLQFSQFDHSGAMVGLVEDGSAVMVAEASGYLHITSPAPLPLGPNLVQVVRRADGAVLATSGIMVALEPSEQRATLEHVFRRRDAVTSLPSIATSPLLSITTTVWDTPVAFLEELADLVFGQTWLAFEWLVLDNGSRDPEVIAALATLASRDPRIRYFRVEDNIHIVPGNRLLLQHARGDYIVPVDSDDILRPDALERLVAHIALNPSATLLYSDEMKVSVSGEPVDFLWRTAPDPLGALSTVPAAHLMAFSRQAALDVDAYSDSYAQGSHDWDTYLRLTDNGGTAIHVPEALYGWRIHSTSAASDATMKGYLFDSQIAVIRQSLARRGMADRFVVQLASNLMQLGYFHASRNTTRLPPLSLDIVVQVSSTVDFDAIRAILVRCHYPELCTRLLVVGGCKTTGGFAAAPHDLEVLLLADGAALAREIVASSHREPFKAILDAALLPTRDDWLRDAVGTLELDDEVGIVGGILTTPVGAVASMGFVAGLDGFMATPVVGQTPAAAAKLAAFCRRRVTAVHGGLLVIRTKLFDKIGSPLGVDTNDSFYGIEFCLRARRGGWHTAFCPTFAVLRAGPLSPPAHLDSTRQSELLERYGDLLAQDPYYNGFLSKNSASYGRLARLQAAGDQEIAHAPAV